MSQFQPNTSAEEQQSDHMAGRRHHSMADSKPQRPRPYSTATGSSIRNCATSHLGQLNSFRPQSERYNTALSNLCQMDTTHTNRASNIKQRLEKAQQQVIDIENEYFALNPWYNEQKEKPVFGLGQPLPHTIRRGMTWGRGDLKKLKEEEEDHGIDKRDGLDHEKSKYNSRDTGAEDFGSNDSYFSNPHARTGCHEDLKGSQVPLRGELPSQQSESTGDFHSTSQGRMANVRLPTTNTAYSVTGNRGNYHENQERAPVNEHGLTNSEAERSEPHRNHFGMQDGLHPLQELDSNETSQTQKEEKEIQQREHESQQEYYNQYRNPIARLRAQYPQAPAEFLATFVYLFLGIASNLSIATSSEKTGNFETQAGAWGFAVTVGIYLAGGVSGGHLSPTITIALSVFRGFPWRMAIVYICMQMLAGLAAGGLAYALYSDAIRSMDPGLTLEITGKALFPKGPEFSATTGFFNDFVFMAVYVCIAFSLGDDQNSPPGQGMTALIFGFMGYLMMVALGYNTGLGISPARDLGPRLVALWAGYDSAFSDAYWAWGPWGASVSGALFGGFVYDLFIFVGGESPVNYRWTHIKSKVNEKKDQAKDQIQRIA